LSGARERLLRHGRITVRPHVTFTPTGGDARTRATRVKLVEKRIKR
jgi:hypothetical protein